MRAVVLRMCTLPKYLGKFPSSAMMYIYLAGPAIHGFMVEKSPPEGNTQTKDYQRQSYDAGILHGIGVRSGRFSQRRRILRRSQCAQEPLEQQVYSQYAERRDQQSSRQRQLWAFYFASHTYDSFISEEAPEYQKYSLSKCVYFRRYSRTPATISVTLEKSALAITVANHTREHAQKKNMKVSSVSYRSSRFLCKKCM